MDFFYLLKIHHLDQISFYPVKPLLLSRMSIKVISESGKSKNEIKCLFFQKKGSFSII